MITRYDFMDFEKQADGKEYPDALSFPLKKVILKQPCEQAIIREEDYIRPDLFFFKKQGNNNMEDVQLWINEIPSRRHLTPGTYIQLPAGSDLNTFYIKNRK